MSQFQAAAIAAFWPFPNWVRQVNAAQTEVELAAVRCSLVCGLPYGSASWTERTARHLGLEYTLRARGRPKSIEKEA